MKSYLIVHFKAKCTSPNFRKILNQHHLKKQVIFPQPLWYVYVRCGPIYGRKEGSIIKVNAN